MKKLFILFAIALTLFSCKHKYTLEELRESVKNNDTELSPLEKTEMEAIAELAPNEKIAKENLWPT